MWQALRSDLQEFVAVVTDPHSSNDGDEGDEEVSPALEESLRRMALDETYTQTLLEQTDASSQVTNTSTDSADAGDLAASREQIQNYVDSFLLDSYEDEISKALEEHGDILQPILQRLVPETVSRKDFWMRYFYHCSMERIEQELAEQENRERLERVSQSIQGVKNFLGGAVMSVASSMLEDDEGGVVPAISPFHLSNVGKRRPPFVMNTAVDEDDDNEEELGWSDDEVEDEDAEAQIEFKDAATEQLQEQLKQALDERDMLHQTVELQQKQIAELLNPQSSGVSVTRNDAVEQLKKELADKEAELATLRSEVHSGAMDDADRIEALQKENNELKSSLQLIENKGVNNIQKIADLEKENAELKASLESKEHQLAEAIATTESKPDEFGQQLLTLEKEKSELETKLAAATVKNKAIIEAMEAELSQLRQTSEARLAEAQEKFRAMEEENINATAAFEAKASELAYLQLAYDKSASEYDVKLRALTSENSELKTDLSAKAKELAELRDLTESLKKPIDVSCGESAGSPGSVVKVEVDESVLPPPKEACPKNDDGSDDWGEDWE